MNNAIGVRRWGGRRLVVLLGAGVMLAGCGLTPPDALRMKNREVEAAQFVEARDAVPSHKLTSQEAIALALERNLDVAVAELERELQAERATGEKLRMLPSLRLNGTRSKASKPNATQSHDLERDKTGKAKSFSEDPSLRRGEIDLSWNLLDFGLSYLQARQEANRLRIADCQIARVRQNLVLKTVQAYWRMAVAQEAAARARVILERAQAMEEASRLKPDEEKKAQSEIDRLQYQKQLLQVRLRLSNFEREFATARAELAGLMRLPPDADFAVAEMSALGEAPPLPDAKAMEALALARRPELFEHDCQEQIAVDEARAEIARLFPSINLFARRTADANQYLVFNNWHTVGVETAINLLTLPRQYKLIRAGREKAELARQRRLALATAIVSQVHLSLIDLHDAAAQAQLAKSLAEVQEQILAALNKRLEAREISYARVFDAAAETLLVRVRYLNAAADLKIAQARLANTVGEDSPALAAPARDGDAKDAGQPAASPPAQPKPDEEQSPAKLDAEENGAPQPSRVPTPAEQIEAVVAEPAPGQMAPSDRRLPSPTVPAPATTAGDSCRPPAEAAAIEAMEDFGRILRQITWAEETLPATSEALATRRQW